MLKNLASNLAPEVSTLLEILVEDPEVYEKLVDIIYVSTLLEILEAHARLHRVLVHPWRFNPS